MASYQRPTAPRRLAVASAVVLAASACTAQPRPGTSPAGSDVPTNAVGTPLSAPSPSASAGGLGRPPGTGYVPPRPPGEPLFVPAKIPPAPEAPDLTFALRVGPYSGLGIGRKFAITVTITNNEQQPVRDVGASILVGDGAIVRLDAPGAELDRICDTHHDPNLPAPCRDAGAEYTGLDIGPGAELDLVAHATVVDFQCPGGGDFVHEVLATIFGPVRSGPNGGRHYVWFENDRADYEGTGTRAIRPDGCVAESVHD